MTLLDKYTLYFLMFVAGWVCGAMLIPAIRWGM